LDLNYNTYPTYLKIVKRKLPEKFYRYYLPFQKKQNATRRKLLLQILKVFEKVLQRLYKYYVKSIA